MLILRDLLQINILLIMCSLVSPAHVMPLLEIVRTPKTSPQVVVDLLDVGKKIRKTPIVVGNCTGFAVNRMFFPYTQSALLFVDHGLDVYKIDQACTKFGMPMGPFRYLKLFVDNSYSSKTTVQPFCSVFLCKQETIKLLNLKYVSMFSLSRVADLVGFGVAVATGMQYLESFPERVYKSMLMPIMLEDKRAGTLK